MAEILFRFFGCMYKLKQVVNLGKCMSDGECASASMQVLWSFITPRAIESRYTQKCTVLSAMGHHVKYVMYK